MLLENTQTCWLQVLIVRLPLWWVNRTTVMLLSCVIFRDGCVPFLEVWYWHCIYTLHLHSHVDPMVHSVSSQVPMFLLFLSNSSIHIIFQWKLWHLRAKYHVCWAVTPNSPGYQNRSTMFTATCILMVLCYGLGYLHRFIMIVLLCISCGTC